MYGFTATCFSCMAYSMHAQCCGSDPRHYTMLCKIVTYVYFIIKDTQALNLIIGCTIHYYQFFYCIMFTDVADIADPDTEAGAVRLVAGSGPHEGRVEVVFLSTWSTVCGSSWDLLDAIVVCRQLGYNTALSASVGAFGEGSGPIWLNYVHCHGNESSLTQCRTSHASSRCNHFQDAGVICSGV